MSTSSLFLPDQAIVLARTLRDAIARTNNTVCLGYKAAHLAEPDRAAHEFTIDGTLGEALVALPEATISFLNLACDTCERVASFQASGSTLLLVPNGALTQPDEMLLARSSEFIKLVRSGAFDADMNHASTLASDPVFDALVVA